MDRLNELYRRHMADAHTCISLLTKELDRDEPNPSMLGTFSESLSGHVHAIANTITFMRVLGAEALCASDKK